MPLLLQASKLVASPNSGLLIARCLVVENQRALAAARYADVERDALNLVRSGETRYAETAAAAAKEGTALRAKLGTLRVRVAPRAGVALEIDGKPTEINADGQTTLFHEPGSAKVTFVLPAARREQTVAINVGAESVVTYVDEEKPSATQGASASHWPWTLYASGSLAVLGLASFATFGLASESTYGDLESKCAPQCSGADRADADRGRTFQTVANISLVVGLVFTAVTFVILASGPSPTSKPEAK